MSGALELALVEPFLTEKGLLTLRSDGYGLTLNLENLHERRYAANLVLSARYPQADVDRMLFDRLVQPGDVVLDAGANIGFTLLQLFRAGADTVIAVEPDPLLCARLRAFEGGNFVVVERAISDRSGAKASLTRSTAHNQGSTLKRELIDRFPGVFGDEPQRIDVDLVSIDELSERFGRFDVWKLDVEGAEVDALRGATTTLSASPPRTIVAELYEHIAAPFRSLVEATHPFAYRAFIRKEDYALTLMPFDTPNGSEYRPTSPMYVFAQASI